MTEVGRFSIVLMAGILLGAIFFGGLWWTVQKGPNLPQSRSGGFSGARCCEPVLP